MKAIDLRRNEIDNILSISNDKSYLKKKEQEFELLSSQDFATLSIKNRYHFLGCALNLLVSAFNQKDTEKELKYFNSVITLYEEILKKLKHIESEYQLQLNLAVGECFYSTQYYNQANNCYEYALNLIPPENHENKLKCILLLMKSSLKQGAYAQENEPAPDIAKTCYNYVIFYGNQAICLPRTKLTIECYYLIAQAYARLAYVENQTNQQLEALKLLIKAGIYNLYGQKLAEGKQKKASPSSFKKQMDSIHLAVKEIWKIFVLNPEYQQNEVDEVLYDSKNQKLTVSAFKEILTHDNLNDFLEKMVSSKPVSVHVKGGMFYKSFQVTQQNETEKENQLVLTNHLSNI